MFLEVTCDSFTKPHLILSDITTTIFTYEDSINARCDSGFTLENLNSVETNLQCVTHETNLAQGVWNVTTETVNCIRKCNHQTKRS